MDSDIVEIKSRIKIEDLISEYIKLKKAGSAFSGLCPFHNEKSPSFHVSPNMGIYKCFGCGESGDIFSFIQKFENLDFPEAKKKLADKAGVELINFSKKTEGEREKDVEKKRKEEKSFQLLEEATKFFQINLSKNEEAKNYLKKRGVNAEVAKKFCLGFALDEWNSLENFLISKNFTKEEILTAGFTKENESKKIYDRFRNRIIFPIFDEKGRVVAFSARDFSGKENTAKYLNSPETKLFNKSSILFGYNFAKVEARKRGYFILVEGQMDLIMSHKIGFLNTVATSGTSLTDEHLKKISHFSKNLIFSFDSDKAGLEATFRGYKKALSMDFDVKILDIPEGNDPADIILKSENEWGGIVKNSKNIISYFIKKITLSEKNIKEKNLELEKKIYPLLSEMNNSVEKDFYIAEVLKNFEFTSRGNILEEINSVKKEENFQKKDEEFLGGEVEEGLDIFSKDNIIEKEKKIILKNLTAFYFWQEKRPKDNFWVEPKKILDIIKKNTSEEVFQKILNLKNQKKYVENLIFEVEALYNEKDENSLIFDLAEMKKRLNIKKIENELSHLQKKIEFCEEGERKNILIKIQELITKKNGY